MYDVNKTGDLISLMKDNIFGIEKRTCSCQLHVQYATRLEVIRMSIIRDIWET